MIGHTLSAVRGALTFLTRLPVAHREGDWDAFRTTPVAFPIVGLVAGSIAAIPLLATGTLPAPTVALGYVIAVYAVTGIHHLDGVADCGDALVVHGDADRRREVLKDTTTGVGALLAVSVTIAALALGGLGLAGLTVVAAIAVVIGAEVGAKLGMAAMACFGTASEPGMGEQFTDSAGPRAFVLPAAIVCVPVAIGWLSVGSVSWLGVGSIGWLPAATIAIGGALVGSCLPWLWARQALGGLTGDVFGAANEIGRVAGVHLGVIAWTLL